MALRRRQDTNPHRNRHQYYTKVAATALAESLGKQLPWAVGFFFGNAELSIGLWTVVVGISGLDD